MPAQAGLREKRKEGEKAQASTRAGPDPPTIRRGQEAIMHRFIIRWRFLALLAPVVAALAFVLFGGGGGGTTRSLATGPTPGATPNLTGVSCSDSFLGSTQVGMTMSRLEPHNGTAIDNSWDITTVSYLGYAGP